MLYVTLYNDSIFHSCSLLPCIGNTELMYRIAQNFDGEILMDTDFKYLTDSHYTPVNAKQFDGLNIDDLTEKRQNFALYSNYVILL